METPKPTPPRVQTVHPAQEKYRPLAVENRVDPGVVSALRAMGSPR